MATGITINKQDSGVVLQRKDRQGLGPKAARERTKSSVNSQNLRAAASKGRVCLPPCLPLNQK